MFLDSLAELIGNPVLPTETNLFAYAHEKDSSAHAGTAPAAGL
jgi:hypothetical protein